MSPEKSEIPIQVLVEDLDLLREMFGSEVPQKGQVVEIDGFRIEFRGLSRTHGMTQQEIAILIAISVGTSVLSSATTVLLGFWIYSKLSRNGKFPVQIGNDPFLKTTSSEITDAIRSDMRYDANALEPNCEPLQVNSTVGCDPLSIADASGLRFAVALSFPGESRKFVEEVAIKLSVSLTKQRVFYDRFYEAELARPNLDTYLQEIYHEQSALVVVFLCEDYSIKGWCGLEFRAVRSLIKQRRDDQIMLVRLDDGAVRGVFDIDGYLDAGGRDAAYVCDRILERLLIPKAVSMKQAWTPSLPTEPIVLAFQRLAHEKPHSVCRRLVLDTLSEQANRWLLLQWKDGINTNAFGQVLSDADAMLISSDQSFGGTQAMQVARGICLIGRGLCSILMYSNTLERFFSEVANRILLLTNTNIECDENRWNAVLILCDRGDLNAAVQALGIE